MVHCEWKFIAHKRGVAMPFSAPWLPIYMQANAIVLQNHGRLLPFAADMQPAWAILRRFQARS
jgi:hypothetical protein